MEEKKFNCKMEDIPVITGFAIESMENDKVDFFDYSPVFTDQYIADAKVKKTECMEMVRSEDVLKLQKKITEDITQKLKGLRSNLNKIGGYLTMAEKELDIKAIDFNLSSIRSNIAKTNVEGVANDIQSLIIKLKRNETALLAKGLKVSVVNDLIVFNEDILKLNQSQNSYKNKRSRVASENIREFNELWDILSMILDAGRSMYKLEDKVKLKEYTFTTLQKRVHTEGGTSGNTSSEPIEPTEPTEPENLV